jgi:hypothetical protein
MKTANYIAIPPELAKPSKAFVAVGPPVEKRFNDAHYLASLQRYTKPFRCAAPGMLLVGEEHCWAFIGSPAGVLLPPYVLNEFESRWSARGLAWSEGLLKLDGHGLSGDPSREADGSRIRGFGWQLPLLAVEAVWAAVRWTLGLGFSAEDFALFATAPRGACLAFLREGAHYHVETHLGLVTPRERLAIYAKAASVLPGFTRREAASAEAKALFSEALLQGITGARAADLLALVNTLTEPEGGAATG